MLYTLCHIMNEISRDAYTQVPTGSQTWADVRVSLGRHVVYYDQTRKEHLTKRCESLFQFISVNVSRVISVKAAEGVLPVCHILPQGSKLLKVYGATVVSVKHS